MKLLDLFCKAGGASVGYARAGFEVEGVDIEPQPHYPFKFYQADALDFPLEGYDAYHASPPCQRFAQCVKKKDRSKHPDYISAVRKIFRSSKQPFVIENVPQAPLIFYITLCGSMFNLPLRRHRIFEANFEISQPECEHNKFPPKYPCAWNRKTLLRVLSISGGYQHGIDLQIYKEGFDINWDVTRRELSEAIPPAYTEYIGKYLLNQL